MKSKEEDEQKELNSKKVIDDQEYENTIMNIINRID